MTTNVRPLNIRPTTLDDARCISSMRCDPEVHNNIHDARLYPEHQTEQWIKNLPTSSMRFTAELICEFTANGFYPNRFVGLFRIDNIDYIHRTCYVGLDITKEFRGKGLAKIIYKDMLSYLFNKLNMDILYLEVLDTNKRACELYEKLGFKQSGLFPGKVLRNGERIDSIIMFLERNEYLQSLS